MVGEGQDPGGRGRVIGARRDAEVLVRSENVLAWHVRLAGHRAQGELEVRAKIREGPGRRRNAKDVAGRKRVENRRTDRGGADVDAHSVIVGVRVPLHQIGDAGSQSDRRVESCKAEQTGRRVRGGYGRRRQRGPCRDVDQRVGMGIERAGRLRDPAQRGIIIAKLSDCDRRRNSELDTELEVALRIVKSLRGQGRIGADGWEGDRRDVAMRAPRLKKRQKRDPRRQE